METNQARVKLPLHVSDAFAAYCFENSITTSLCWVSDDFFTTKLTAIVFIPKDFTETFVTSEWGKYISK